jgi:hypothetical protein
MTRHGWLAALARMLSAIAAGGHQLPATANGGMMSSLLPASIDVAQPLAASHDGGNHEFLPMSMADSTFRQSQWRELISATPNGGNSHVSPLGAPARSEMAIKFGGGHLRQFDWAEVYICKKIGWMECSSLMMCECRVGVWVCSLSIWEPGADGMIIS